ncbi:MAG: riboflavin biosynthesis protein RibF, partial [SAR324 cluster bacterium]|nr:riboflavin biosynthesis protein RibF [SAR324 cluster bacterium]
MPMQLIRGLHNLKKQSGCVLTIGNFDGVHIGHQKIIKRLVEKAHELKMPSLVISFSVTPESFFGRPKARLSSFRDKHLFLKSMGVDKHLLIRFNNSFSQTSATSFVENILVEKLKVRHCFIGDDFRFGKDRLGNYELLEDLSKPNNYFAENVGRVGLEGQRVSSSAVRLCLSSGNFSMAERLLGRPFVISGRVSHGDKRGRTIGFPTINVGISRRLSPVLGVFNVLVEINKETYTGVCNVGKRPTVGGEKTLLEVFIFDF